MIETATGLVLRTRPLTESSLIVQWLTPTFGRLATVAKGARRPNSPFRGKIDLFYFADFSFRRSRRSELHTLSELTLLATNTALRHDLGYLEQASYCTELVEQTTETETPLPGAYELLKALLEHLPKQPPASQTIFAFELKLLNELGLQPDAEESKLNPGTKRLIRALAESDWPMVGRFKLSESQMAELGQFLHGFLIYHLDRIPKERAAALGYSTAPQKSRSSQAA